MGKLGWHKTSAALFTGSHPYRNLLILSLLALTILACSGFPVRDDKPRGVYHRVRSGETLSIIARAYRVDLQELAEINNIDNPDRIAVDDVIFIPEAQQIVDDVMVAARPQIPPRLAPATEPPAGTEAEVPKSETVKREPETPKREPATVKPRETRPKETKPAAMAKAREPAPDRAVRPRETAPALTPNVPVERPRPADKEPAVRPPAATPEKPEKEETAAPPVAPAEGDGSSERIRFDKKRFAWPVKGRVVSRFGIQPNRMYHNGIRIAAAEGVAVQAAADGLVIFSAPLKDYGETIIIQHDGQYATVYTRLGVRTVRAESRVRRGDRIGFLGKADHQEEAALDFEVRFKNKARNPLFFLP